MHSWQMWMWLYWRYFHHRKRSHPKVEPVSRGRFATVLDRCHKWGSLWSQKTYLNISVPPLLISRAWWEKNCLKMSQKCHVIYFFISLRYKRQRSYSCDHSTSGCGSEQQVSLCVRVDMTVGPRWRLNASCAFITAAGGKHFLKSTNLLIYVVKRVMCHWLHDIEPLAKCENLSMSSVCPVSLLERKQCSHFDMEMIHYHLWFALVCGVEGNFYDCDIIPMCDSMGVYRLFMCVSLASCVVPKSLNYTHN